MTDFSLNAEIARSGHSVLKYKGRYLASSFDPIKEAFAWAKRASLDVGLPSEGSKGSAIIIGAGCGYHVAALKEMRPDIQILALEVEAAIAEKALEWNPILTKNMILVGSEPMVLTDAPQLRDAMAGTYAVIPHHPTTDAQPEWSAKMMQLLLGRDKLSFLLQLRMRPELHSLLDPKKIAALGDDPISIKTLQKLFKGGASGQTNAQERQIWRVLEELVL